MTALPQGLNRTYRSHINRFLCHLEQHDRVWSQLVPPDTVRPTDLETVVNAGIRDRVLPTSTRAALNTAFRFVLQAESGIVQLAPVNPAHTALMAALSQTLSRQHRSQINRFLCHLEQHDLAWSQLVPPGTVRPTDLETVVNAGIRDEILDEGTRAALNTAFGFVLQAESGRVQLAPVNPAHTALMAALPQGLSQPHRSHINRFLCHLEQHDLAWSQLVAPGTVRPADLETAVNAGIRDGLHRGTRAALNTAFGFDLRS